MADTPLFDGIITKDDALVDGIANTDSALVVEYARNHIGRLTRTVPVCNNQVMDGTHRVIEHNDIHGDIVEYTIDNNVGMKISALSFGATVCSVLFNDCQLLVAFEDPADVVAIGSYVGSTVGRVANRIKNGVFTLGGRTYSAPQNFLGHTLHGGTRGFSYVNDWRGSIEQGDDWIGIRFRRTSPHLEEGFPGTVVVDAWYKLTANNDLIIEYYAETDAQTILNLTNHAYWNLNGGGNVGNHNFFINADRYLVTDEQGIFNGVVNEVNERLDFTTPRRATAGGVEEHFDVAYVVNQLGASTDRHTDLPAQTRYPQLPMVACVSTERTAMIVSSTYPTVQFFLPYQFPAPPIPSQYVPHGSFCLECQMHLDAHRFSELPSTILEPGARYHHQTIHQFYALK